MSTRLTQTEDDSTQISTQVVPHLQEFLSTVPTPLTSVLVGLSPCIKCIRRTLEIVSWRSRWDESWLVLGAWWMLCLCSGMTLRYLMPVVMMISVYYYQRWPPYQPPPITEQHLRQTVASLTIIRDLLTLPSSSPAQSLSQWHTFPSLNPFSLRPLLRAAFTIYPFYLTTTYFVPLRILIGIAGTIVLTWHSRWAGIIRNTLWRSAHVRWGCYRLYSLVSGEPLPPAITPSSKTDLKISAVKNGDVKEAESTALRFLFTLHENQRWWISLDWTSALLPAERPPWSSPPPHFTLLSPPSSFSLPPDAIVYQDMGAAASEKIKRRVKRHARWSWEEPEWKVVIRQEGSSIQRQERELPSEGSSTSSTSASKLLKGVVNHRREGSTGKEEVDIELAEQQKRVKSEIAQAEQHQHKGEGEAADEPYTDADGWIYGDNKWENQSAKGGMGKYTRYRRWTRIAVLTEIVELVDNAEGEVSLDGYSMDVKAEPKSLPEEHAEDVQRITASRRDTSLTRTSVDEEAHGSLRQRLKAAVKKTTVAH